MYEKDICVVRHIYHCSNYLKGAKCCVYELTRTFQNSSLRYSNLVY